MATDTPATVAATHAGTGGCGYTSVSSLLDGSSGSTGQNTRIRPTWACTCGMVPVVHGCAAGGSADWSTAACCDGGGDVNGDDADAATKSAAPSTTRRSNPGFTTTSTARVVNVSTGGDWAPSNAKVKNAGCGSMTRLGLMGAATADAGAPAGGGSADVHTTGNLSSTRLERRLDGDANTWRGKATDGTNADVACTSSSDTPPMDTHASTAAGGADAPITHNATRVTCS